MPAKDTLLFSTNLISDKVQKSLPPNFIVRPLSSEDYDKGFLETLSHLTVVGDINRGDFAERFNYVKTHNYEYYIIVIEDLEKNCIAAAGTVFVERKFLRQLGKVGHIEDIVVNKNYRGHQFGRWIIEQLKHIGFTVGCYKIILDCEDKNIGFYQKLGFTQKEVEMVWYIPRPAKL